MILLQWDTILDNYICTNTLSNIAIVFSIFNHLLSVVVLRTLDCSGLTYPFIETFLALIWYIVVFSCLCLPEFCQLILQSFLHFASKWLYQIKNQNFIPYLVEDLHGLNLANANTKFHITVLKVIRMWIQITYHPVVYFTHLFYTCNHTKLLYFLKKKIDYDLSICLAADFLMYDGT